MWFRKKPNRRDIDRITKEFQEQTAGITNQWALDAMGAESFLPLLTLADHARMGKTRAVLIAFKLGFMKGREDALEKIEEYLAKGRVAEK